MDSVFVAHLKTLYRLAFSFAVIMLIWVLFYPEGRLVQDAAIAIVSAILALALVPILGYFRGRNVLPDREVLAYDQLIITFLCIMAAALYQSETQSSMLWLAIVIGTIPILLTCFYKFYWYLRNMFEEVPPGKIILATIPVFGMVVCLTHPKA